VFTDKRKCEQAEKESKIQFIKELMGQMDLIKDICNSKNYCEDCPFNDNRGNCKVSILADNYLDIVNGLQGINN
jgi:hypothetical protein